MKMLNIFYSWQSDWNDYKTNNQFIRQCIDNAIKEVKTEKSLEIYLDDATRDEPGTIHIPISLENKIREANIFICDLSIINPKTSYRKTPNPNVIYELALASENIDWSNIICIINEHYGNYKLLPFDFGFRYMISYTLRQNDFSTAKEKVKEVKEKLKNDIMKAILTIIETGVINNKIRLRDLIKKLHDSEWVAYDPSKYKNPSPQDKQGEISIKFLSNNIFEFDFKSFQKGERFDHGDWTANVYLNKDALDTGRITFETRDNFGLKELVIKDDRMYLIGINHQNEGWGKEVLIRKN